MAEVVKQLRQLSMQRHKRKFLQVDAQSVDFILKLAL
jgi:hypothetical protein